MGHSAVIHSENRETIQKFAETVKVGRIIVKMCIRDRVEY